MSATKSNLIPEIETTIQFMRTLTTAQLRKQLEYDKKRRPDRLAIVVGFFKDAKEQTK